ncbi:hypothetical protein DIPPA_07917 [Diplonema papillatum]|nr:hypothetical protein DIPPA_07917 [Diplonema papillatum]
MERLSFGEAAAVVHYNAFAKVLAKVVRLGLKVPLCQYYDDFAAPCRLEDDGVLADVLELLRDILLTAFNPDKTSGLVQRTKLGSMVAQCHSPLVAHTQ